MSEKIVRAKDITEEHRMWAAHVVDQNDSWSDYISWKDIRRAGYEAVVIDGDAYEFSKWGLTDKIPISSVRIDE